MAIREIAWSQDYPGIMIRVEGREQAYNQFFDIASSALNTIASQPVGKGLLRTMSANNLMYGRKVSIAPLNEKRANDKGSQSSITYAWAPSSTARSKVTKLIKKLNNTGKRESLKLSCTDGDLVEDTFFCNGPGCGSTICWNHDSEETPDGRRPPWIGLAHEMIHAFNNLHGIHEENPDNGDLGKKLSEAMTVGLGRFANNPFTENRIRAEHSIPPRLKYTGVIEGNEVEIFG